VWIDPRTENMNPHAPELLFWALGNAMHLIPKKWADFQHYKDRCPPWIKLHRDLLNDREFMRLPLASKALAPLLWLLASESKDGSFDASLDELEFRLRLSKSDIQVGLKSLIDNGFFIDASTLLAPRLPDATPEREGETKKEREKEIQAPEGVAIQTWQDFQKLRKTQKAPLTQSALDGIKSEATKAGWSLDDAMRECCARGWRGFKAKWVIDQQFNNRQIHAVQTVPSNAAEITKKMLAERDIGSPPPKEIREAISLLTGKK